MTEKACVATYTKIADKNPHELRFDILEFAYAQGLLIHPDRDLFRFCENAVGVGHCPCKDDELCCPCPKAIGECQRQGHCTCRLLVTRDAYLGLIAKSREYRRRKEQRDVRKKERGTLLHCKAAA